MVCVGSRAGCQSGLRIPAHHDTGTAAAVAGRWNTGSGFAERSVSKNDAFLIPAGTVHAIGAGILLAEIQQSSNLTYRLYDYNRTDAQGEQASAAH